MISNRLQMALVVVSISLFIFTSSFCDAAEQASLNGVSDAEMNALINTLWKLDENRVPGSKLGLDMQGHTSSRSKNDAAAKPLFGSPDEETTSGSTYKALEALFNNYNPQTGKPEDVDGNEEREEIAFIDAVAGTKLFHTAREFLAVKGLSEAGGSDSFKRYLRQLWFPAYSRAGGKQDSSAFEHVFIGEWKNGVSGLHNWYRFSQLEAEGEVDYKGNLFYKKDKSGQPIFVLVRYDWDKQTKPAGSFFVGTSPEFELALYTTCFLAKPGRETCRFTIDGQKYAVTSYPLKQNGKVYLGTAYPGSLRG